MTNDEFHEKLDTLARETHTAMAVSSDDRQVLRDALEEAIKYDHELHSERKQELSFG